MFQIPDSIPGNAVRNSPWLMETVQAHVRVRPPQVTGRHVAGRNSHSQSIEGKIRKLPE